ncbi:hypothetical protein KCU87_g135, partial [Aureobasidium melanogenum]
MLECSLVLLPSSTGSHKKETLHTVCKERHLAPEYVTEDDGKKRFQRADEFSSKPPFLQIASRILPRPRPSVGLFVYGKPYLSPIYSYASYSVFM